MITTVNQGLTIYEKALSAYLKRSAKLKKRYGHEDWLVYSAGDYHYLSITNDKLSAMEKVLNITKREKSEIKKKIKAGLHLT